MHNELIQDLASILLTGGIMGWVFKRFLKLPLTLGYIFAGIFITLPIPYTPMVVQPEDAHMLAELGVLLLLFSMGLHFGVRKIKTLGFKSLFVGSFESLSMLVTGIFVAKAFGFQGSQVLFLGAMVAASSTVMIIKTLEDFGLKSARFAEKLMGVLLVEDSVAIFVLIWLSTISAAQFGSSTGLSLEVVAPLFVGCIFLWWLAGTIVLPRAIQAAFVSGKEELLVVLSVGLVLGLAYVSQALNFSSALGAFIMGSILSESRELKKIEVVIEPVKNLFSLIFFVSIGLLFSYQVAFEDWKFILVLSAVVIVGKVFYNFVYNMIVGQGIKDSLRMAGIMGHIGELSFVIAQAAKLANVIDEKTFSSIVAVSIITILSAPFVMKLSLHVAENSEKIIPRKAHKFLDSYARFVLSSAPKNKMIFRGNKKVSFLEKIRLVSQSTKNRLHKSYMKATSHNVTSTLDRLAPWDEYLVPVNVEGNSYVVGKTLLELKLREKFNVNVVAIERDPQAIIAPNPVEIIMTGDTLLVYGVEDSVVKLEQLCQGQAIFEKEKITTIDDCALEGIALEGEDNFFVEKSILDLGIREMHNCIVLAVNRGDERIKNPNSNFVFHAGDEVFLFGTKKSLEKMKGSFS